METHFSILDWRIPMDRGAWWATIYGITKSRTQLSDQHTRAHTHTHTHTEYIALELILYISLCDEKLKGQ